MSCSLRLLLALEVVLTAPLGVMLADLVIRVVMMMVIIDNDDDDDHLLSWDSTMAMGSVPTSSMMSTSSPAPAGMSTCATLC